MHTQVDLKTQTIIQTLNRIAAENWQGGEYYSEPIEKNAHDYLVDGGFIAWHDTDEGIGFFLTERGALVAQAYILGKSAKPLWMHAPVTPSTTKEAQEKIAEPVKESKSGDLYEGADKLLRQFCVVGVAMPEAEARWFFDVWETNVAYRGFRSKNMPPPSIVEYFELRNGCDDPTEEGWWLTEKGLEIAALENRCLVLPGIGDPCRVLNPGSIYFGESGIIAGVKYVFKPNDERLTLAHFSAQEIEMTKPPQGTIQVGEPVRVPAAQWQTSVVLDDEDDTAFLVDAYPLVADTSELLRPLVGKKVRVEIHLDEDQT